MSVRTRRFGRLGWPVSEIGYGMWGMGSWPGSVDAVQVIYNIFDQNPEDELFPACREHDVAVIARVPFDEGTLTGTLTKDSTWPEGMTLPRSFRACAHCPTSVRIWPAVKQGASRTT